MIAQVIGSLNQLTFMTFVSAVTHHIYNKDAGGAAKQEEAPVLGALSVIRTLPGVRCELYSTKQLTLAQIKTLYFWGQKGKGQRGQDHISPAVNVLSSGRQ